MENLLDLYFRRMGKDRPLDRAAEQVIAREYRRTGKPELARRLVRANLRLVVKIAHEYRRWARQDFLDLIEEGNVGLLVAVTKFDPDRGVRLSTYAAWWIRAFILRFIVENWRLVRIGTSLHQRRVVFRLRHERRELERMGITPDAATLAARLGMKEEAFRALEQHVRCSEVALEAPASGDDSSLLRIDRLAAPEPARPDRLVEEREYRDTVHGALEEFAGQLAERDRSIFRSRWMTEGPQPTLDQVGSRLGVSRERARQLEARILGKLRPFLAARVGTIAEAA